MAEEMVAVHFLYASDPYQAGENRGLPASAVAAFIAAGIAEPYVEGVTPTHEDLQVPARAPPVMVAMRFIYDGRAPYQANEIAGIEVSEAEALWRNGVAAYVNPADAPVLDDPPEDPAHLARRTELGMTDVEFAAYLAAGGT